jgi:phage baseplate assembly protein W
MATPTYIDLFVPIIPGSGTIVSSTSFTFKNFNNTTNLYDGAVNTFDLHFTSNATVSQEFKFNYLDFGVVYEQDKIQILSLPDKGKLFFGEKLVAVNDELTFIELTSDLLKFVIPPQAYVIDELYDDISINNALHNIFSTPYGSVPGKPEYGSKIFQVIFDQLDFGTEVLLKSLISEEILKFEPRILKFTIDVTEVPEYNKMLVEIHFTYRIFEKTKSSTAKISLNL